MEAKRDQVDAGCMNRKQQAGHLAARKLDAARGAA